MTDPIRVRPPLPQFDNRQLRTNVTRIGVQGGRRFDDAYHRLLVTTWPRLGLTVLGLYLGLNLLFAALYAIEPGAVRGAENVWDLFFFSVQTMATIGYGGMTPATPWANLVVTVEALIGLVGFAMGTGLMLAKFARPTARVAFSNKVVIGRRDGQRYMMFRMGNARANQIVEAQLNVVLLCDQVSAEGQRMRRIVDLPLERSRSPMFTMNWTAFHRIDEESPLHGMDEDTFSERVAGVLLSLTGLDATFNQTIFAQHGYNPEDIAWNCLFADMIEIDHVTGHMTVDHRKLHEVVPQEP